MIKSFDTRVACCYSLHSYTFNSWKFLEAGTRAAAEKLYTVSSNNMIVPNESFDSVIGKLLPAQQRTVRSVIPKLTTEDKEFVESFKKARPRSSIPANRQSSLKSLRESSNTRPASAVVRSRKENKEEPDSNRRLNDENNPLAMVKVDPMLKRKRLSTLGKGDLWPEFPEEPNGAVQDALRKSWCGLIQSSTVQTLLPTNGASSMENYIAGCDLIMKSITHSRNINDPSSIIEQLDLILKWAACALISRDHTVALRAFLAVVLALFERLHELQYIMTDNEAKIFLPYFLDKAGTVKTPFQDQFLQVLSFITSNSLYSTRQYGSHICVKVLEKSTRSKSRLLAANQIELCVQTSNLPAIGKKGLNVLGAALSNENLVENRGGYLSLFDLVLEKLDMNVEKLFSLCSTLNEKAQGMVMERHSKNTTQTNQNNTIQPPMRLKTPSRMSSSSRISGISPRPTAPASATSIQETENLTSSSAAATESLRQRFQRSQNNNALPPPSSQHTQVQAHVHQIPQEPNIATILQEIEDTIQDNDPLSIEDVLVAKIDQIVQAISTDPSVVDAKSYDNCARSLAG